MTITKQVLQEDLKHAQGQVIAWQARADYITQLLVFADAQPPPEPQPVTPPSNAST